MRLTKKGRVTCIFKSLEDKESSSKEIVEKDANLFVVD